MLSAPVGCDALCTFPLPKSRSITGSRVGGSLLFQPFNHSAATNGMGCNHQRYQSNGEVGGEDALALEDAVAP